MREMFVALVTQTLFPSKRAIRSFAANVIRERTYLLLTGLELRHDYDRWRPFGHVMAGVARQTQEDVQTSTGDFNFKIHDHPTAWR